MSEAQVAPRAAKPPKAQGVGDALAKQLNSTAAPASAKEKAADKPANIQVKMTDGRDVEFPPSRRLQKDSFIDDASGALSVRLDFVNGETRTFVLPSKLVPKFALHGAEQKLGDEIAGEKNVDDAVIAIDELIKRLNAGEFNAKREAGGMSGTSVLAKAMVEVLGKPKENILAYLSGKSQAEKMALRNSDRFRAVVQRIEAESASASSKVDMTKLTSELDAI